jgi:hypothetical protein
MPNRPTGAIATPRHRLAAAKPHLLRGATPAQFITIPPQLSYWLNNVDGDCVTAEEAFAKACCSPEIFISDAEVKTWATKNGVMNGAIILDVIQTMETAGFSQDGNLYNDGTPASVDWTNTSLFQNAISQGPIKLGVAATQLQTVVGTTNGWLGTGFTPVSQDQEDHCISACGYGPIAWLLGQLGAAVPAGVDGTKPGYAVFTWDTIGVLDVASLNAITFEAWLRTPTTIIVGPPSPPNPTPTAATFHHTFAHKIAAGQPVSFNAPVDIDAIRYVVKPAQ